MSDSKSTAFAGRKFVAALVVAASFAAAAPAQASGQPGDPDPADASSLAAESGYVDAEQAFDAVFIRSGLGWRGYVENREYAAAIYQMPDGRWHVTRPVAGNLTTSSIPYSKVPSEAIRVVGAHTHGQPHIAGDPSHLYGTSFSEADRRAAIHNYQVTHGRIATQLLLTSRLEILEMNLSEGYDAGSARIGVIAHLSQVGRAVTSEK